MKPTRAKLSQEDWLSHTGWPHTLEDRATAQALPGAAEHAKHKPRPDRWPIQQQVHKLHKRRLLLVEDNPSIANPLRMLLVQKGWEVMVAGSVAEALALLDRELEWVILDLMLPDGDGTAVLRKVRDTGLPVHVAVATGTSDPERLRLVDELHPEARFHKPIPLADLFHCLDVRE